MRCRRAIDYDRLAAKKDSNRKRRENDKASVAEQTVRPEYGLIKTDDCFVIGFGKGEEWFWAGIAGGRFVNPSNPITQISFDKIRLKCKQNTNCCA
jgi:hypothetical protein